MRATIGVAAGIGAHGFDAHDWRGQEFARQGLDVVLYPFVQLGDHVAGQRRWWRKGDLRLLADTDEAHWRGRPAFVALAQRPFRYGHDGKALEQDGAARLGEID